MQTSSDARPMMEEHITLGLHGRNDVRPLKSMRRDANNFEDNEDDEENEEGVSPRAHR